MAIHRVNLPRLLQLRDIFTCVPFMRSEARTVFNLSTCVPFSANTLKNH